MSVCNRSVHLGRVSQKSLSKPGSDQREVTKSTRPGRERRVMTAEFELLPFFRNFTEANQIAQKCRDK